MENKLPEVTLTDREVNILHLGLARINDALIANDPRLHGTQIIEEELMLILMKLQRAPAEDIKQQTAGVVAKQAMLKASRQNLN